MILFAKNEALEKCRSDLRTYLDKQNPFALREAELKFFREEKNCFVFHATRKIDNALCRIEVAKESWPRRKNIQAIREKSILLRFFQKTGVVPWFYRFEPFGSGWPTLLIFEWLVGRNFNELKKEPGEITDEHLCAAARAIARFCSASDNPEEFRKLYSPGWSRRLAWFLRDSFRRHMLVWFWRMVSTIFRRSVSLHFDALWWTIKILPDVVRGCRMLWRAENFFNAEPRRVHFDGAYAENLVLLSDGTVKFARLEPLSMRRGIAFTAARFMETIGGSGEAPSPRERKVFIEEFCKEAGIKSPRDFERLFLFELLAKFVADTIWVLWKAAWSGTHDPIGKASGVQQWRISLRQIIRECQRFV